MADKKPSNPLVLSIGEQTQSVEIGLRDIFAAAALAGLISAYPDSDAGIEGIAHDAYSFSDAMLAEREK